MTSSQKVNEAFIEQHGYCARLGSPFMARACTLFAENLSPDLPHTRFLYEWPGDISPMGINIPLRLFGALHYLVLSGQDKNLATVYPPHDVNVSDETLWVAFNTALKIHESFIASYMQHPPQTNEVGRSAILLPGFCEIAKQTGGLPFVMSEIGASAGLNLNWDLFHYTFAGQDWGRDTASVRLSPDWQGHRPALCNIDVVQKSACDQNPVPLGAGRDAMRLLSYTWPDQLQRLQRTRAAINIAEQQKTRVDKADAYDWLKTRLDTLSPNKVHVIYHTIVWQYFPDALKAKTQALIEAAGTKARKDAPLAWLAFEADGKSPGAALSLTLWPGGEKQILARADYHGRWIDWQKF